MPRGLRTGERQSGRLCSLGLSCASLSPVRLKLSLQRGICWLAYSAESSVHAYCGADQRTGNLGDFERFHGLQQDAIAELPARSEEHTSELQSRGLISYAVFCLKNKKRTTQPSCTQCPYLRAG